MGRPARIARAEDGTVSVRTTVGSRTWDVIDAYTRRLGITHAQALRAFMLYIEDLISDDQTAWLPLDWRSAVKAERDRLGGIPLSLAAVDQAKLHRSDKTKSGFHGVYANGAGFRATGRHAEYLGTYKTAIEAATMRYLHYKKNSLPYGELEIDIDRARKSGEQGTDKQLKEIVLETARLSGTLHVYGDDGIQQASKPQMLGFGPGGSEELLDP